MYVQENLVPWYFNFKVYWNFFIWKLSLLVGACFKLKEPKWAMGVERCLGALLQSFCCHDHHDEKVLESVFDRVCNDRQRPSIIVSRFKVRVVRWNLVLIQDAIFMSANIATYCICVHIFVEMLMKWTCSPNKVINFLFFVFQGSVYDISRLVSVITWFILQILYRYTSSHR